jgi:hypothetical protein
MILLGLAQPEAQSGCPIAKTITKKKIVKMLSRFHVYSCFKDHIFSYKLEQYRNHIYKQKFPWKQMPTFLFHWFERILGWHYLIKARCVNEE